MRVLGDRKGLGGWGFYRVWRISELRAFQGLPTAKFIYLSSKDTTGLRGLECTALLFGGMPPQAPFLCFSSWFLVGNEGSTYTL